MMSQSVAVLGFLIACGVSVFTLSSLIKMGGRDEWYEEGWADCKKAYKDFGMTADDEEVLKELKSAFKPHIKSKGYHRKGDYKKIEMARDFDEFRHVVWEVCVQRRLK